jgi:hypothetical protein
MLELLAARGSAAEAYRAAQLRLALVRVCGEA